ncbi:type I-B CRISPR-associated endonuclease Cas1b [Peptoniphilus stercorisuis]|uniref:CRISPR-associated endonuclease Cas1 n=1 Tax=Peptoniphilus stercorisuis TaxID=1436965 RepID=A0ABS4KCX3_9FIRM|nr:type I-B CRISPR-associated endonuclease Cas1b [Peptoniphilus stercorisuis]MBP2025116.1 CRISPR-associated protein Cas1 [Peptoniphilus stercorisuis]
MNEKFYIFSNCRLKRKDNNLRLETKELKKDLKVEIIDEIYIFGEVDLNTKVLNFLAQNDISLHIFNYYGFYSGSFFPRDKNINGDLLVKQVKNYLNKSERLAIAKEIEKGAAFNIFRNLRYYNSRDKNVKESMNYIKILSEKIDSAESIEQLMGYEGNIRREYYSCWEEIIDQEIDFKKRVKRPPDNMINSLISYLNSMMYTTVLSEIYKTQLDPTISYLHEPGTKRFSLSLDLAELFKPLIVDRLIFSLLNKNQITEDDFVEESNFTYLKENSRQKIILEYNSYLERVVKHKELNRYVSYTYLIRLECYKLIKHIIGEKEYESFKFWW